MASCCMMHLRAPGTVPGARRTSIAVRPVRISIAGPLADVRKRIAQRAGSSPFDGPSCTGPPKPLGLDQAHASLLSRSPGAALEPESLRPGVVLSRPRNRLARNLSPVSASMRASTAEAGFGMSSRPVCSGADHRGPCDERSVSQAQRRREIATSLESRPTTVTRGRGDVYDVGRAGEPDKLSSPSPPLLHIASPATGGGS